MNFPELFISRPGIVLPSERLTNEDVLGIIRSRFRGRPEDWPIIEMGIRTVFEKCGTAVRYLDPSPSTRVAGFAARAGRVCLDRAGIEATALDQVVYGGIAREYFEPATAMELAVALGTSERVHGFDITSACVGVLEALYAVAGHFALDPGKQHALIATGELSRNYLSYDIQTPADLLHRAAGLTIGNAAAAFIVSRTPHAGGSARLLSVRSRAIPKHWALCTVPIDGAFTSFSIELFRLHVHVAPEVRALLDEVGWSVKDVRHFILHQPSDTMVRKVLADLGADPSQGPAIHGVYANTVSAAIPVTFDHLIAEGALSPGDKIVFATAAAGFSVVCAAAVWCG